VKAEIQRLADAALTADHLRVEVESGDVPSNARLQDAALTAIRDGISAAYAAGVREVTMPVSTLDVLTGWYTRAKMPDRRIDRLAWALTQMPMRDEDGDPHDALGNALGVLATFGIEFTDDEGAEAVLRCLSADRDPVKLRETVERG
jgi:hypothetical protein